MVRLLAVVVPLLAASGCANDCSRYCDVLADRWRDCGIDFDQAQVSACKQGWRKKADALPGDSRNAQEAYGDVCRQLVALEENADGDRVPAIVARYTCDEMRAGPGGAFGGG